MTSEKTLNLNSNARFDVHEVAGAFRHGQRRRTSCRKGYLATFVFLVALFAIFLGLYLWERRKGLHCGGSPGEDQLPCQRRPAETENRDPRCKNLTCARLPCQTGDELCLRCKNLTCARLPCETEDCILIASGICIMKPFYYRSTPFCRLAASRFFVIFILLRCLFAAPVSSSDKRLETNMWSGLTLSLLSSKSTFSQPSKEKMHKLGSENLY